LEQAIAEHLAQWGLRRFTSDEAYFQWQRQQLSPREITDLHDHVEQKRRGSPGAETAFYDLTASPRILPVLYSQRYEYYQAIAPLVAVRLVDAKTILDFGCGPGILATFYARRFSDAHVTGLDRSPASIARAQQQARAFGLENVRFECVDFADEQPRGTYERIVATHALVQSEQDPGLPSHSWRTFERPHEEGGQTAFERRTGLDVRLDRLTRAMTPDGRLIVFEKTRQLGRRIAVQRALAARGFTLVEEPQPIRYSSVEEITDDGPLFVLRLGQGNEMPWNEKPETDEGRPFDRADLKPVSDHETPLYENHWPSAQRVWEQLGDRTLIKEQTAEEPDGRQLHVELGTAEGLRYLYCANTFDQRQLVIVEPARAAMLHTYYQEIIQGSA
jgi:SAM-dependent methyltransferase